jgi:hypothetical protein
MARLTVYPFRVYDISSDEEKLSRRMGTIDAIAKIHGAKALLERGVEIDKSRLDPGYPGLTPAL